MHYSQSPPLAEAPDLDDMSDPRFDRRDVGRSIPRSSRLRDDRGASYRPSLGKRIFRALTRFLITVLIGVGGTLAWQSDTAREMLVARAPTLAWLLSVSTTNSSAMAATSPVTATSPDPAQALEPLTSNLDAVRRSVEQLADKQDQMAQNIAALQAVEEDIRQKMSSTPALPSPQAAPIPQRKPLQPRAQPLAVQSPSVPRSPPPAGPVEPSR
jgi:hypothetical protein